MQGAPISTTLDWQGAGIDDIIDCRSPAEFAYDHIPGAMNCWVLDDAQRARVGTVYKQQGAFDGRRLGAGLVSINIGKHLAERLGDKPKGWQPLVYCWRGGQRSGAFATVLGQIGYRVRLLDGGYKQYRRRVLADQDSLCAGPRYIVLCGKTGVGKTRLLRGLAELGEQVLDLEGLANHRGSLFGALGLPPQPSAPYFDSLLHAKLSAFEPERPVWVEAESAKIGERHLPKSLVRSIRAGARIDVDAALDARVATILEDYDARQLTTAKVLPLIGGLPARVGGDTARSLSAMAQRSDWPGVARLLITAHYDPSYARSVTENFAGQNLGHVQFDPNNVPATLEACLTRAQAMVSQPKISS